jgi:hypothetical protein
VRWYEEYIGKPWKAQPSPPDSFNCGELLRHVYLDRLGIEAHEIHADALNLSERVKSFTAAVFGLRPLGDGEPKKEFDCAFMRKTRYEDHCGVAVRTADGLLILHCLQRLGVVLESPLEVMGQGFRHINWYRYKDF